MARLVTKFKYLKPGARQGPGGYARYIATREGVDKIDDSQRLAPVTKKQEKMIAKLLKDFPDSENLLEYADYLGSPNMGNASEFISRAIEDNADDISTAKTYADYIATRPRAQRFGSHGLFTDDGVQVQLEKISEELNLHDGNIWTAIISLRREDAERLGFNNGERWRDMLRTQTQEFGERFHIPLENLKWFAAFHNESHHPHVHLMIYSTNPKEGFLTQLGVEHIRSTLGKAIFAQDLQSVYEKQTEHRDALRAQSKELIAKIVEQINAHTFDNPALEQKLLLLAERLSKTSGKKVYGYLKSDVKDLVDSIVDDLAGEKNISALYDLWYQQREEVIRTYTENIPERVPLSQNDAFKSVRNAVIHEAMAIVLGEEPIEESDDSAMAEPDPPDEETEAEEQPEQKPDSSEREPQPVPRTMWSLYKSAKELLDKDSEDYDPNRAVELLIESAKLGCGVAKYRLGKMFLRGDEVPQDIDYALRWLEESASEGNQYAEYLLGKAFLKGNPVDQDTEKGETLLRRSYAQGNRYAAYTLGKALLDGDPIPQNTQEAIELLKFSADKGFPNAEYLIGKFLYRGEIIPQDIPSAVDYLEKASGQKNSYAAYLAGKILLTEETVRDVRRAIAHFEIAAKEGNDYAEYQLGKLYLYGRDVERDYDKAMEYLRSAADHGNVYASQLLNSIHTGRSWSAAMGTLRLLQHISRIIQDRLDEECKTRGGIDRKLKRIIDEKKEAHGLKQG